MTKNAPFVLFDDAQMQAEARLYVDPVRIITCSDPQQIAQTLAQLDKALDDGFHVAGYLAYELGYLLEDKLATLLPKDRDQPLIWFGVFKAAQKLSLAEVTALMDDWASQPHNISPPKAALNKDTYLNNIQTIQDHIRAGDVYQINYTFQQSFQHSGSPKALYAQLRGRQRAKFGAMIRTEDQHILSLSPELFYEAKDGTARTRPMKGTAPRAPRPTADKDIRHWLCHDEKSKAENLMIVDLLRNDLSRISQIGSVKVTDLFTVETYPTLHQMTSTIESQLAPDTPFSKIIQALFPCGSVTGAPKVKAMEIINTLETEPRGVYTGAIGYASAHDGMRFNVAIRTLTLDPDGTGKMGIGSAIVYDSKAPDEWTECHLKANFVTDPEQAPFALLETLKWTSNQGFVLLDRHLERLQDTADYFGYPIDINAVKQSLKTAVSGNQGLRVRLTLSADGEVDMTTQPLPICAEMTYTVSDQTVNPDSPFTYHKTTNRAFYDEARAAQAADEVLFLNAGGNLCEGSITNIFVEKDGQLLTPPVSEGILPGTLRGELLATGQAVEASLTLNDLNPPNTVYLGNSVRGLVKARPL